MTDWDRGHLAEGEGANDREPASALSGGDEPLDIDRIYRCTSPRFGRRLIVLPAGGALQHDDAIWQEAIVFVIAGDLQIECADGERQRFHEGAILTLARLPVERAFNSGSSPLQLLLVWRSRSDRLDNPPAIYEPNRTLDYWESIVSNEHAIANLSNTKVLVVGASRGLGRGVSFALLEAGAHVVAISRTPIDLATAPTGAGSIKVENADASDPKTVARLLDEYDPYGVVLVAGATPPMRPLQKHTWRTFSLNWETDVRLTFHWLKEILLKPLRPGGKVVVFSSGAAINPTGSPLSGGYAGANATQSLITGYAQDEANHSRLGLHLTTLFPQFAPETAVGKAGVKAYAAKAGLSVADYVAQLPYPPLTPKAAGAALVELMTSEPSTIGAGYLLNGAGLHDLSRQPI